MKAFLKFNHFLFHIGLFLMIVSWTNLSGQEQLSLWNLQDILTPVDVNENIEASGISVSAGSIVFQNGNDDGGSRIGYATPWSTENEFDENGKYLEFSFSPNDRYEILLSSISLRFGRTAAGPTKIAVQYSLDGFETQGQFLLVDGEVNSTNTGNLDHFPLTDNLPESINGTLTIRIWGYAGGTGNLRFNNFRIYGVAQPEGSNLVFPPAFSPNGGSFLEDVEVSITSLTDGAAIYYKTSEEGDWVLYEEALTISQTITLWAYAEKEGMDNSEIHSVTFQFPIEVASIAELRQAERNNNYYTIAGEVVFTFFAGTRNQVYIQDKDGVEAILIDDAGGIITTEYDLYNGVINLTGRITGFRNMMQFVPAMNPGAAESQVNEVTPQVVSLETLNTAFINDTSVYQGRLVHLENVKFISEATDFSQGGTYQLIDLEANTINLRTPYPGMDYLDQAIPDTWQNITGVILQEEEQVVIVPRFLTDFEESPINENLAATPVIDPAGGQYIEPVEVSITTETEGASVFYTFAGADANELEWMEYSEAITISESCTLWAVSRKDGMNESAAAKAVFTFPDPMEVPFITRFSIADNWDLVSSAGSYGLKHYEEGGWYFTAESAIRDGDVTFEESAYSLRSQGDLTITNQLPLNGLGGFRLWLRDWRNDPKADREVQLSLNGGVDFTTIGVIDANWAPDGDNFYPFTFYLPDGVVNSAPEKIVIRMKGESGSNNYRMRVGAFEALEEADFVTAPGISPNGGNFYEELQVSISTTTTDADVYYKTTEEGDWVMYEDVITISETTTLWAYATKEGMQESETVSATFRFPVDVDDIAMLRSGATDGTYYRLNGQAVVTFLTAFRNQMYIQDATAAILIDDPNGHITSDYVVNDAMEGIIGSLTTNFNMLQLSVATDPGEPVSSNNVVNPMVITIPDLNADYQAMLVTINDVVISHNTKTIFERDNFQITDKNENVGVLRPNYEDLPYLEEEFPVTAQNITGVILEYNGTMQLIPRSWNDFEEVIEVGLERGDTRLILFPNPVDELLSVSSSQLIEHLKIINSAGTPVKSIQPGSTSFTIDVSSLPAGLYFVQITRADGQNVISKIIVK